MDRYPTQYSHRNYLQGFWSIFLLITLAFVVAIVLWLCRRLDSTIFQTVTLPFVNPTRHLILARTCRQES